MKSRWRSCGSRCSAGAVWGQTLTQAPGSRVIFATILARGWCRNCPICKLGDRTADWSAIDVLLDTAPGVIQLPIENNRLHVAQCGPSGMPTDSWCWLMLPAATRMLDERLLTNHKCAAGGLGYPSR